MEVSGWYNAAHPKSQTKMVNSDDMRIILGVIGNVTSFFQFASPLPIIWEAWKNKEEQFRYELYHPLAVTVIYCIMSMVVEYIAEFVFLAGLTWTTLESFDSHATRSGFVGFFCDFIGIILSAVKLIRMKHVKLGLLLYSLVRFLNGVIWSAYALIKFDIYILIDNGVGAAVGGWLNPASFVGWLPLCRKI